MSNPLEVNTVKCAGCGRLKQEANHWFIVRTICGVFGCYAFEKAALVDDMRPVCGQTCAQKLFETWMTQTRNASTEAQQN